MPCNPIVLEHFNRLSATGRWSSFYDATDGTNYHMQIRRIRVMELLPGKLGHVLDVGCGPGVFVDQLLERGATYEGIDISPEMIREANRKCGSRTGVQFQLGTLESLNLKPNSYDQIIAVGLLEYLSELDTTLMAIADVLRPGGIAVLTIPKRWHIDRLTGALTAPPRAIARLFAEGSSDGIPRIRLQPDELDSIVSRTGLLPSGGAQYHFTPFPYPVHRIAPNLCMRLNLPFNRWYKSRDSIRSFFAHGYIGSYRKL
jgi:2-polyprenyl-3-methyl-5-hydroxy-6-metoxy-1,4-benzoquinol methylase